MMKLKDLYLDDLIQKDEYTNSYKELEIKLKEYSNIKQITVPNEIKQILNINIRDYYETLDRKQKQALWQSIIKEIIYNEDKSFVIYFI